MRFSQDRVEKLNCSDGVKRSIHIWEPANPSAIILAVHGGLAHGGDYCTPALWFKEQGIATISWDQHGHDGKEKVFIPSFEVFLDDLELMLGWVKGHYENIPVYIMGHSMGALISTHFGLKRMKPADEIQGFIMSSPYYVNAIKTPAILVSMAGILSSLVPQMAAPLESFTDVLTHDPEITARHHQDEKDNVRATKASIRFGNELLKAQKYIPANIAKWNQRTYFAIAGTDKLADADAAKSLIEKINPELVTMRYYPDNYHENFNETNREEIFADILSWMKG